MIKNGAKLIRIFHSPKKLHLLIELTVFFLLFFRFFLTPSFFIHINNFEGRIFSLTVDDLCIFIFRRTLAASKALK